MSASLDRPIAAYRAPGADQQPDDPMELVQKFLALAGAEGPGAPDITQAMTILMTGLQSLATQRTAGQNQQAPPASNEAEPFDTGNGDSEAMAGYEPTTGAEFTNVG